FFVSIRPDKHRHTDRSLSPLPIPLPHPDQLNRQIHSATALWHWHHDHHHDHHHHYWCFSLPLSVSVNTHLAPPNFLQAPTTGKIDQDALVTHCAHHFARSHLEPGRLALQPWREAALQPLWCLARPIAILAFLKYCARI